MIKMIAAVSRNGVIGQDNKIPFDYPEDLKFFRIMTARSTIIMGRKTFEGIGKVLPHRRNIVVSRTMQAMEGIEVFDGIIPAVQAAKEMQYDGTEKDIWLIGGTEIYRAGMLLAERIFLTLTPDFIGGEGLVYFPWIDPSQFEIEQVSQFEDSLLKLAIYKRLP